MNPNHRPAVVDYECKPIRSFDELQKWRPGKTVALNRLHVHYFTEDEAEERLLATIPAIVESVSIDGPKVLICHDMKGGYLEDRFVRGSESNDVYTFFHWSEIDWFIYFSHHFVTIPPITWTTAAHRNGVPMFGTFITEGSTGYAICRKLLSSSKMVEQTVEQLVRICEHFRFEGWLINIENYIEPSEMNTLIRFLTLLTQSMHEHIPGSKVVWYDSVVYPSGSLSWQNELNSSNIEFFNVCDAIFLNYGWSKNGLQKSAAISEQHGRKYDVFVGIDVFGRGMFGGGGMNTDLAVNEITNADLSMAIFAPGWVHEILGSQNFHENQVKFWSKLKLPIRRLLSCLPFESNFCRGFGNRIFKNGLVYSGKPWSNLMLQDIQTIPNLPFHMDDGFEGGGCLRISNDCDILHCHITVPESGCLIILVHKPFGQQVKMLVITGTEDGQRSVLLSPLSNEMKSELLKFVDCFQLNCEEEANVNEVNGWSVDAFLVKKEDVDVINTLKVKIQSRKMTDNFLLLGNIKILESPASQFNAITVD